MYGTGDLDDLGVKVALDKEGPPLDPDAELPAADPDTSAVREYLARRFPALADAPLKDGRSAATSSPPTPTSSPPAPGARARGSSAAARATASSTARRSPSGRRARCAAASRCPRASGSAIARPGSRCARRVPVADNRGTFRFDACRAACPRPPARSQPAVATASAQENPIFQSPGIVPPFANDPACKPAENIRIP